MFVIHLFDLLVDSFTNVTKLCKRRNSEEYNIALYIIYRNISAW